MGQHSVASLMAAPWQNQLITLKVVPLEKVSFSDTQNHKAVCLHIDIWWEALSG